MSVPTLICPCGQRLKAPGLKPGRTGRCPQCGGMLKVPDEPRPPARPEVVEDDGWGDGLPYELGPSTYNSTASRAEAVAIEMESRDDAEAVVKPPRTGRKRKATTRTTPAPAGPWWPPDLLYPARGTAEALGVIGTLSVVLWIFTILIPEYCASLQRDADSMGAGPMGYLISLVTSLPAFLLTPLAVFYALQYLARVLVARAMGDPVPPRSPDRNFDGFLSGLGPWLIWFFLSGAIAALPLLVSRLFYESEPIPMTTLASVGLVALPYGLMVLMLSFLHDDQWAAKPWVVAEMIVKLNVSFAILCISVAAVATLSVLPFVAVKALYEKSFWVYIPATLFAWSIAIWGAIVIMGTVGGFYYKHRGQLRWHQERPRWGVAWKL